MVTMKQVGLNVASDPLMSLEYIGVKGGMVIMVADDPGPISSQTEQDTRRFADFCRIPVFDPASPEEAFEMIQDAFDYSEKYAELFEIVVGNEAPCEDSGGRDSHWFFCVINE